MAQRTTSIDLDKDPVHGRLKAEKIIEKVKEFSSGNPTELVLWILEDAVTAGIFAEDIEKIINVAIKIGSRKEGRTAVVGSKEIDYGLGRMYQAYADMENMPYQ